MSEESWDESIGNILKSMDTLVENLKSLEPRDRLGYVNAIVRCINALYPSSIAAFEMLHDPRKISSIDPDTLKSLFERFRDISIEHINLNRELLKRRLERGSEGGSQPKDLYR